MKLENVQECLCGNVNVRLDMELKDIWFNYPGTWNYVSCSKCNTIYISKRIPEEKIGRAYESYADVNESIHKKISLKSNIKKFISKIVLRTIFLFQKNKLMLPFYMALQNLHYNFFLIENTHNKILDFGCGIGKHASKFKSLGYEVLGVEFDDKSISKASQLIDVIHVDDLYKLKNREFDLIYLSHVIEHVYDPIGLIKFLKTILSNEGKIVMVTPNADSRLFERLKTSWRGLEPPRHIYIFSGTFFKKYSDIHNTIHFANRNFYTNLYNSLKVKNRFKRLIVFFKYLPLYIISSFDKERREEIIIEIKK